MAATPTSLPSASGKPRMPRGRGRLRALVIVFSLCVSFLVIDAFAGERGLSSLLEFRREVDRLTAEVASKKRDNATLREKVRRLSGEDPAAIEDIARRELGLIRPGERLFIIQDVARDGAKK